ncbi:dTDP-4-dehydrorhamnose 3,5-epimerase [Dryocola clanedunensis]|uniref:dTDP-4-dehydrorhamnose 3,5-epimerase n=1 Tax=Cedecea sulfonylureivorans TaxID=3051154 RepID=UPI001927AFD0|nr:dTDP-4-dehydrorhamnose 3,5-epimerase [Cedecea sulfonylureivorans]
MNITKTTIKDLLIIEPDVYHDERGFFLESFNQKKFNQIIGENVKFVQDNHSKSKKGVLRGMHFQAYPYSQGKLVQCIHGEVFDVAVDLREKSPTFAKWFGINLSAENKRQLWIPEGFAHGFLVLSESADFIYKTTNYYNAKSERSLKWNDKTTGIVWPHINSLVISEKDLLAKKLEDLF